ncbi:MAG: four helix bundle protein [Chitinophagaceae bacterium]|nr:MAG: four helix bundle protein [Chitinophagaceae bacterium]
MSLKNVSMSTITKLEEVKVWLKARALAKKIYALTFVPPISNDFRLRDQMRGSSGSTMDNIAEGFGRGSQFEAVNSYSYAKGEAEELKSQLYRCYDVGYIDEAAFKELYEETDTIVSMLFNWIKYLNECAIKGQKFKGR